MSKWIQSVVGATFVVVLFLASAFVLGWLLAMTWWALQTGWELAP